MNVCCLLELQYKTLFIFMKDRLMSRQKKAEVSQAAYADFTFTFEYTFPNQNSGKLICISLSSR